MKRIFEIKIGYHNHHQNTLLRNMNINFRFFLEWNKSFEIFIYISNNVYLTSR